jgi:hypothetical protein
VGFRIAKSRWIALGALDFAAVETSPSLSVQWLGLWAGAGAQLGTVGRGPMLEPSIGFGVRRLRASTTDGPQSDSGAELEYGPRATVTFVWQLGLLSPFIGAHAWFDAEPVEILVHDQYVGRAPRAGGAALLGLRLRIE